MVVKRCPSCDQTVSVKCELKYIRNVKPATSAVCKSSDILIVHFLEILKFIPCKVIFSDL